MELIDREKTMEEIPIDVCDGFEVTDIIEKIPTVPAIPIPKGATNGDMVKAMFPNYEETRMCGEVRYGSREYVNLEFVIDEDWWDAPYKGGI